MVAAVPVVGRWQADILPGFEAIALPLPDVRPAPGEPADTTFVATLVRRASARPAPAAVLYLHGWNDYFFQSHLADRFADLGYDFYAIDLRRYGRSLRPGQLRGYIDTLDDYDAELDQAADVIAAEHDRLLLLGHSTGGLIAALWASRRAQRVHALLLNSPWLDLHRPVVVAGATTAILDRLAASKPTRVLRLPDLGLSVRTMHISYGGEWDYDLDLKSSPSPPMTLGWLSAVRAGHARVAAGLGLPMPVLVLISAKHAVARRWHEGLRRVDTVLDVDHMAQRAMRLGCHVTVIRVPGAMHDVILSATDVRERAFEEIACWCSAYG